MAVAGMGFLAACSTIKHLPEGDSLYVGIDEITYLDSPYDKAKAIKKDTAGVISSIGHAVKKVDQILNGKTAQQVDSAQLQLRPYKEWTKEEKKHFDQLMQREQADFSIAKEEVEAVLAFPPNNALFGSSSLHSPLQFGLWTYNQFHDAKYGLGKWIFKVFASDPVLLSAASPEMRSKVATNTLHNYGYFRGKVDYEILPMKNPKKSKVAYRVYAGPLSRLDSIAYLKFPAEADSLLRRTMGKSFLRKGDAFNVVSLASEQSRIEKMFRENGYYYYAAPYTIFRADTLMTPGKVQLQVMPSPTRPHQVRHPWYIGNTYITVRRHDDEVLDKTFKWDDYTFRYAGKRPPLRIPMWYRSMVHRRGMMYRHSDEEYTLSKLNALEVFSQLDMSYVPRDTVAGTDTLDVYITAKIDKLFDSSFEMNTVFKSNQQVGPGISFGLAKRNAFGGGEKVAFKLFGSYEWQTGAGRDGGNSLLNSYELGTELSINVPRFLVPHFGKRRYRFPSSTTFSLNADWRNRAGFFNIVTLGANVTYKWSKFKSSQHELTLLALDFDKMLHTTTRFDSIMNANPALSVSMRNQFIPSMSYTFTYASAAHHRNPVWLQIGVKEAGNLVSGIYAAFGKDWNQKDKNLFENPFVQFVKVSAEFHQQIRLNHRMSLAGRFFGGVVYSYGNSLRAPYADQFYVGGANSVRGFAVRTIGPGGYQAADTKYAYIDQTGDVKLEANAELRSKLFGSLYGALFLDAGNVWLLREDPQRPGGKFSASNLKKIAVSTGFGFRYDLDFLVLRFDVGVPLHAPYPTTKSGWYNIEKFWDGLAFHFAIGYPF
ncbi:outer membrane protein, family [gut metagenome]|uniref:Outer membrane protein, family n=1 Tax=gut metagenome TaxID=749906 RepID=J9FQP0_9ZZZZ